MLRMRQTEVANAGILDLKQRSLGFPFVRNPLQHACVCFELCSGYVSLQVHLAIGNKFVAGQSGSLDFY